MDTMKTMRAAAGAFIAIAMLATSCSSGAEPAASTGGADASGAGASGSVATGPSGQADPLAPVDFSCFADGRLRFFSSPI